MYALIATTLLMSPTAMLPWSPGERTVYVEGGELGKGEITGVVDAPLEAVLATIEDCDRTDEWFPKLMQTHVVATDDLAVTCGGMTDMPWPLADRTWEIEVGSYQDLDSDEEVWVVPFMYVGGGDLDAMYGGYHLRPWGPDGQQTLVTYEAWVDLGIWIPPALVSWATKRVLPALLDGLEDQAQQRARVAMR